MDVRITLEVLSLEDPVADVTSFAGSTAPIKKWGALVVLAGLSLGPCNEETCLPGEVDRPVERARSVGGLAEG